MIEMSLIGLLGVVVVGLAVIAGAWIALGRFLEKRRFSVAGEWPRTRRGEEFCSVSHVHHAGGQSFSGFAIGDRVEGGEGEARDIGTVIAFIHPPRGECDLMVVWDSGVRTWAISSELRRA